MTPKKKAYKKNGNKNYRENYDTTFRRTPLEQLEAGPWVQFINDLKKERNRK